MSSHSVSHESYPGLMMAEVLANLGGNRILLAKLARLFLQQHAADITLIEAALTAGDRERALSLTHALRGTAGTLGAMKLHDVARALETALGTRDFTATVVPTEFHAAMAELVPSLERLVSSA